VNAVGHLLGLDDPSGGWYLFYSGIGSFLPSLAILGGFINLARRHNCAVHGCWRVGRHKVDSHMVCRLHHPDGPLRAHELAGQAR